jgi:hypothetical protein
MQLGVNQFNEIRRNTERADAQRLQAEFDRVNITLSTGEAVSRNDYNKLSPVDQATLNRLGVMGFTNYQNQIVATQQTAYNNFLATNTKSFISDDWFPNSWLNELAYDSKNKLLAQGAVAWQEWAKAATIQQVYKDYNWKPDFNSPTPYLGMPSWYQAYEAGNFIPTTENAVPPSQAGGWCFR